MAQAAVNNFVDFCRRAGLPKDSLERFLAAGYVPQPKQVLLHAACRAADNPANAAEIGYGGALGGGKTHGAFAQITIDDCQRFENLKVLFLRKVGKYAKESLEDLRRAVLPRVTHEFKNGIIHFPNMSRVIIGSYQYEKDIDNYLSLEYDIILIEQAEQISGKKIDLIKTRNRSSKGFRPRMYYTFNPGGLSHGYLKEKFIKPYRDGSEKETKFIFANHRDNAFLDSDYENKLEKLKGWQRRAWRDGDWDILAGQFFTNFRYERHVRAFDELPAGTEFWCALDYGFTHYTAVYLLGKYDGKIYVIDRHRAQKMLPAFHAVEIKAMLARHGLNLFNLQAFVAGADCFQQKASETGKTIADQYAEEGIYLTRANTDRVAGAGRILELLGDEERNIEPKIIIHPRCSELIEQLQSLQHHPHRPEDVLKTDADEDGAGGDDDYDAVRYGVMVNFSKGAFL